MREEMSREGAWRFSSLLNLRQVEQVPSSTHLQNVGRGGFKCLQASPFHKDKDLQQVGGKKRHARCTRSERRPENPPKGMWSELQEEEATKLFTPKQPPK